MALQDDLDALFQGNNSSNATQQTPPAAAPVAATSAGQVADLFTQLPAIKSRIATAQGEADQATEAMVANAPKYQELSDQRTTAAQQTQVANKAIGDQIVTDASRLRDQSAPLFQRMTALSDQRANLDQMNPIVRSLFGFFDRNYNPDFVDSQINDTKGQLATRAAQFQTNLQTYDAQLAAQNKEFDDSLNVVNAQKSGLDTQQQIHSNIAATASDAARIAIQGFDANLTAINAQRTARADLLDQMSQGDVNKYLTLAQKNGGQVVVNGIPLGLGELKQQSMSWDSKNLSLANLRLANASENLGLKEANESWHIGHMGRAETQAAIQNGGRLPDGTQLDVGKLTNHVQELLTSDQANEYLQKQGNVVGQYSQSVQALGNSADMVLDRAKQLGAVPNELNAMHGAIRTMIQQQNSIFQQNKGKPGAQALVQSSIADVQKQQLALNKYVEDSAEKMSGGDKDKRAFYYGWLSGSQIDPGAATNAMIKFAMTHTPPTGQTLDPASQAAWTKVQGLVDGYMSRGNAMGGPGQGIQGMLQKQQSISEGKIPADLQAAVADALKGSMLDAHMNQVMRVMPQVAAQIKGPDGKPHPASRINPMDLQNAIQFGDQQSMEWLTKTLKVDDKTAATILSAGKNSNEWSQWLAQHKSLGTIQGTDGKKVNNATLDDVGGMYNAIRSSAMTHALDSSGSATPDFQPSKAFVDLWNNPQFQQMAVNYGLNRSQTSPMAYAIGAVTNPNIGAQTLNYANRFQRTWSTAENAKNSQQLEWSARFRNLTPGMSAVFTANAVGLNDAQSKQLVTTVLPIAQQLAVQKGIPIDQAVDQVILNNKFADPAMESIRQHAAKEWVKARDAHLKGFAGIVSSLDLLGNKGNLAAMQAGEADLTGSGIPPTPPMMR